MDSGHNGAHQVDSNRQKNSEVEYFEFYDMFFHFLIMLEH